MVIELEKRRDIAQWFRGLSAEPEALDRRHCPRHDVRLLAKGDR